MHTCIDANLLLMATILINILALELRKYLSYTITIRTACTNPPSHQVLLTTPHLIYQCRLPGNIFTVDLVASCIIYIYVRSTLSKHSKCTSFVCKGNRLVVYKSKTSHGPFSFNAERFGLTIFERVASPKPPNVNGCINY